MTGCPLVFGRATLADAAWANEWPRAALGRADDEPANPVRQRERGPDVATLRRTNRTFFLLSPPSHIHASTRVRAGADAGMGEGRKK